VIEFDFIGGFTPTAGESFDSFLVAAGGIAGLDGITVQFEGAPAGFTGSITDVNGTLAFVAGGVAPVDEPQAWMLLVACLPLVGWIARRRKTA
jgi:hypothetical protein